MPINQIKKMLYELINYKDSEITHIFSNYEDPFIVSLKKGENPNRFLITFINEQDTELLTDLETAARVIDELVQNKIEEDSDFTMQ
ncbi:hypothetical protein [Peribacillus glennii]|uniref:DUF1797 family protein n=1 Tax=Peribacillus glennii TaxID=2303991 RepID=A0A372L7P9_9BACI|nr:hypothetical protein [Peribacillus glennii]RFU61284.1 hypothetical protein D0466_18915 [Peribacillus glennii]